MPPVKEHAKSSFRRTGRSYAELHEWMDSEYKNPSGLRRHEIINIPENIKIVEKRFGSDAVKEFLWHIKEDFSPPRGIVRRIMSEIKLHHL
ncbi:MAG TPA: hypothetical protein VJA86_01455 [Candidatus Nanoarchaeia archaeon]|nr:hypothetical protein [Candidatus Nanoarchaeia archaeon]